MYATHAFQPPRFVVKVLSPASEEEAVITRLQRDRSSRNHPTPCEIIRSDPALLLMPSVCNVAWPMRRESDFFIKLCTLLKVFRQIAEVRTIRTVAISTCSHAADRESTTCTVFASHTSYAPPHLDACVPS